MENDPNINEEVQSLLDSLTEHGKNQRRQQDLSALIDNLEAEENKGTRRNTRSLLWWVSSAAAVVLIILALYHFLPKSIIDVEEVPLAEASPTPNTDFQMPDPEPQIAEFESQTSIPETQIPDDASPKSVEQPSSRQNTPTTRQPKPQATVTPEPFENTLLAETLEETSDMPITSEDIAMMDVSPINQNPSLVPETPSSNPQPTPSEIQPITRKIVKSTTLVAQNRRQRHSKKESQKEEKNLMGKPQDVNMQGSMLVAMQVQF